ncbi:MAG: hypothetical protein ACHQEM_04765 [Chitinophagales bacterium]
MPIGSFLDSLPKALYIGAHILFIVAGFWAMKKAKENKHSFAPLLWLYIITQFFFLAFFGDIITMKMAVLLEQTLLVIMVLLMGTRK